MIKYIKLFSCFILLLIFNVNGICDNTYYNINIIDFSNIDIRSKIGYDNAVVTNVKIIMEGVNRVGGNEDSILYVNFVKDISNYINDYKHINQDNNDDNNIIVLNSRKQYIDVKNIGYNLIRYTNKGEKQELVIDLSTINDPDDSIIEWAVGQSKGIYFSHWKDEDGNIISTEKSVPIPEDCDKKVFGVLKPTVQKIDGYCHLFFPSKRELRKISSSIINFTYYVKDNNKAGIFLISEKNVDFSCVRFILKIEVNSLLDDNKTKTIKFFTNRPPVLSF